MNLYVKIYEPNVKSEEFVYEKGNLDEFGIAPNFMLPVWKLQYDAGNCYYATLLTLSQTDD